MAITSQQYNYNTYFCLEILPPAMLLSTVINFFFIDVILIALITKISTLIMNGGNNICTSMIKCCDKISFRPFMVSALKIMYGHDLG